jgi:hypothetical protein
MKIADMCDSSRQTHVVRAKAHALSPTPQCLSSNDAGITRLRGNDEFQIRRVAGCLNATRKAYVIEILAVLGIPLIGASVLALVGDRRIAPTVNVTASFLTFAAATALTIRVITDGPLLVLNKQFFVDPFNVFLVALTASSASRRRSFPVPTCGSSTSTAG